MSHASTEAGQTNGDYELEEPTTYRNRAILSALMIMLSVTIIALSIFAYRHLFTLAVPSLLIIGVGIYFLVQNLNKLKTG